MTQLPLFVIEPEPELKDIEINRCPSIQTIIRHAWGAAYNMDKKDDDQFIKAWTYTHAAEYAYRRGITPGGYKHRAHHHILPQIACCDFVAAVDAEFKRRGMDKKYCLVIGFTA